MEWIQADKGPWLHGVVELARRGVKAAPDRPTSWQRLSAAQFHAGDIDGSVATLRDACVRFADDTDLKVELARAEMVAGHLPESLHAVDQALQLEPNARAPRNLQFHLLVKMGAMYLAGELLEQHGTAFDASDPLFHVAVRRARSTGQWQPLLDLCDHILQQTPGNTGARYFRALALVRLGRPREACLDPAQFLSVQQLPPPAGHTAETFADELRREILANPTLEPDPRGHTTQLGKQTKKLPHSTDKALPLLFREIQSAVDHFEQTLLASSAPDPFLTQRPRRATLSSWAVVYPGEGLQRSHIHVPAWMSGVYYVAAPPGGRLLLGAMNPEDAAASELPWKVERIQPQPNMLVLFPSFIPHATEATHSDQLRICVAFDVMPE